MEQASALTPSPASIEPPFEHQKYTTKFILEKARVLNWSDPGTGKTRASLDAIVAARAQSNRGRALVIAPKTILEPSWVADAKKFTPELSVVPAYAQNRAKAFKSGADVVVTNHDAATWLVENKDVLKGFDILIIDESTAFKNRSAQRSRAVAKLARMFDVRVAMTGTPMPNGILDVWHQVYIVDDGEHLGTNFYKFRSVVCEPVYSGFRQEFVDWREKDGAREAVADILRDITVRFRLEDCIDIPPNVVRTVEYDMPAKLRAHYMRMVREAVLEVENGAVTAVSAAAKLTKLLQIASGAVYEGPGVYHTLDTSRYELIAELCDQRPQTLVAFLWQHQRDGLAKALNARGLPFVVIDGDTPSRALPQIVERFQRGEYRVCLAHPQSASHGLTLTAGTTTIWASPTFDAERYEQFCRRIYRAGQKQKTETLLIQARDTIEQSVYDRLQGKLTKQLDLLELMHQLTMKEAA